jgi:hypothetical protein
MKWTLIVVVFGAKPVQTDLVFNTLDDCLKAEEQMRAEYTRAYDHWAATKNGPEFGLNHPTIRANAHGLGKSRNMYST